jgi:nucleoside-diphosphate-sugar epimerase
MREIARSDLEEVLHTTGETLERLRGSRLLITGGTGFVGHWLLESLLFAVDARHLDLRVALLTRDAPAFRAACPQVANHSSVTLLQGDVRSFELSGERFTHVVHAATSSSAKAGVADTPLETLSVIVDGTRRVLELSRAAGARRLLFVSSGAVYGRQPFDVDRVPEQYTGAPDCMDVRYAYGHAKRLAEQMCAQAYAAGGPEPVIARAFAFVGAHLPLDAHFAIGNFLRDGLSGRAIRVGGDGTVCRSYLYGTDLAAWLWTMLVAGAPCRPYNVGSEASISIGELAARVGERFGVPVEVAGQPTPGVPPERYVPSTARARGELGLEQRVDLKQSIDRTARWYESID